MVRLGPARISIVLISGWLVPLAATSGGFRVTATALDFGVSLPSAINNARYMAGQAEDLSATILTPDGHVVTIPIRGDVLSLSDTAAAVSGYADDQPEVQHCFRLDRRGLFSLTSWMATTDQCLVFGINNEGAAAGTVQFQAVSQQFGYFWDRDGRSHNLGTLPGYFYSEAYDINNADVVVGIASSGNGSSAFRWTLPTGMEPLPFPPGDWNGSAAYAINDGGDIAGFISGPGKGALTVWRVDGSILTYPASCGFPPSVSDINALGWVAGCHVRNGERRAYVWIPGQAFLDLNELSGLSGQSQAEALNDLGKVVGMSDQLGATVWRVRW